MTKPTASTRSLIVEREFPHPPNKVWRALTEGPLIEGWLMKNDFRPVAGHRFTFRATPMPNWNGVTDCEVLAIEPNERLSYSFNASGEEAANGYLDSNAHHKRSSRAHGAVRLPARRRVQLSGRELRLAAVCRGPGTSDGRVGLRRPF